jgi:hypothetical protein
LASPSREKLTDDFIATFARVESALQRKLPSLQKSLGSAHVKVHGNNNEAPLTAEEEEHDFTEYSEGARE